MKMKIHGVYESLWKNLKEMEWRSINSSKWVATVASIWIQCSIGAYAFGLYSPVLKSSQNYDQSTLDTIGVFKDIGASAGLLSGLLYSAVAISPRASSSKFVKKLGGPWIVIATGAVQCFVGYFFMWLAVTGRISRPPVSLMCLFMFLAAHAQTFFSTANVVTAVQNFPDYSGTVVGIMKGFLGLSGAIFIQAYQTIFEDKPSSFLLMLALLPTSVSLLFMFFVRVHDTIGTDEKKHLNGFSIISLILAAYLMITIILENTVKFGFSTHIISFTVLLIGVASPIGVAIRAHFSDSTTRRLSATSSINRTPLLIEEQDHQLEVGKIFPKVLNDHHVELNLLQAMKTIEFWLLFLAMVCGLGSGIATVDNISQIGGSLGYTRVETTTLVSLWSIWNFLGRIGAGFISDYFLHLRGWARPIFMAITLATMGIGHLVIASGLPGALYAGSTLVGVCYGSQSSLMPTITSEVFGVAHMGTIFNTIGVASPVGSYILSVRVIGYIYDKEASIGPNGNMCFGPQCFMLSFVIMATVSTLGFLFSLGLFFRTRRFYKEVIFQRLHNSFIRK